MEEKAINRPSTQPYMTVEEIYNEYCGRRSGLIRALTQDVDILYELCDPQRPGDKKLCLFGYPDCSWNVRPPFGKVPPKIPEPLIGINVIRNEKDRKDWITMVALHSDSWLMAVTFYYAIWSPLDKDQRALLVSLIHSDTNVYEAVIAWNEPAKDNTTEASGSKSRSTVKKSCDGRGKQKMVKESDVQYIDHCGMCTGPYRVTEFWIKCTHCQVWYHGTCVNVTMKMVGSMGPYICPFCLVKRLQPVKGK